MATQLVCPKCKYEFQYNNGYFDENIARLGIEMHDIINQLAQHKLKPKNEQYANTKWWLKAKKALTEKQKQLSELKAFRKLADQQREQQEMFAFKDAVREICGEVAYQKCLEMMKNTVVAYNISDMAKTEYTRKSGEIITSINKL